MKKRPSIFNLAFVTICGVLAIVAVYLMARTWNSQGGKPKPKPEVLAPSIDTSAPPAPPKDKAAVEPKSKKPDDPIKPREDVALDPNKIRICPNSLETAVLGDDKTLFGHRPYADAAQTNLSQAPTGFSKGSCALMHGEAKIALDAMLAAARADDPAIGEAMVGLSCFRSIKYQRDVFCRKIGDGFKVRAKASAPPGYSEHATGYAIDFGDKNVPECNLSACFAGTPVGIWLAANAGSFGFVLSFPKGNAQGVMYEPWHWRYEGSPAAKAIFSQASQ